MADRLFATFALLVIFSYGFIAFTGIKAPFQYDPLGPESWPRLLSIVAMLCCLWIIFRPDTGNITLNRLASLKLIITLVGLIAYAILFEPLGFILSTALFCTLLSRLLGATNSKAALFGVGSGVIGYFAGVTLLKLNLPTGLLSALL